MAVGPLYDHSEAALRRAFVVFDTDGSGFANRMFVQHVVCVSTRVRCADVVRRFIETHELRAMLVKLKLIQSDAPDEQVQTLVRLADSDGDGKVSFGEFVNLFSSSNPVARASVRAASLPGPRV